MNTIKLNPSIHPDKEETVTKAYPAKKTKSLSIYKRFIDFAESQTEKRTAWFAFSIIGPGVLFLPVPAALMYYYNAPIWTLAVTVLLFFTSFIAGMGGSKVSVLIALLGLNTIVNVLLVLMFVL